MNSVEASAEKNTKYLLTGATGFIGSQVFCDLVRQVGIDNVVLLVRKIPDSKTSLFAERLKADGLSEAFEKIHFVTAPFANAELFQEALNSLEKSFGSLVKWRVIHMAAIIARNSNKSSNKNIEDQDRINVGVTQDLIEWANTRAELFVFTSSIASFGGVLRPEIRSEKDFDNFPQISKNFSYFTSKRKAHQYVLQKSKIAAAIVCPGIVHGALDSFKDSRPHLELLRNKKLRLAPRGGGNFVGLDRVARMIVQEACCELNPNSKASKTVLSVDRNMSYKEYFDLYLDIYFGRQAPKIYTIPKIFDKTLLSVHRAFSDFSFWPKFLTKLPQASLFMYFNSEFPQPPTKGLEESLRDSLTTLAPIF